MNRQDLIIIGAGPAGMAAAAMAARYGASVTLIDEQPAPGGQIYRNLGAASPEQKRVLGPDYAEGGALLSSLQGDGLTTINSAVVWDISESGTVTFSQSGRAQFVSGRYVLIATGATERPMPVPGWTLPGVMTAGAAQILIKTSGLLPQKAVLTGAGPLLYLLAAQMVAAGSPPLALVETQTWASHRNALRHSGGALTGWRALVKGLGLLRELKRAGVPRFTSASDIGVLGDTHATGLRFSANGHQHRLDCDTVLMHQGVVPNTQITRMLRLDHSWCDQQRCFAPDRNAWGQTSNAQIFAAGDGSGIGGAKAAEYSGQLAAAEILQQCGFISQKLRDDLASAPRDALARELAIRPFLDTLYAPPEAILRPADAVTICRCEEVTAGDIRRYASLGCKGPNQTKAFGRSGMGPCQGRYCGLSVTELLADATQQSQQQVGSYRIRAPLKPVTLGEIAALEPDATDAARESSG